MPQIPAPIETRIPDGMRASPASGLFVAVVIIGFLYFGREVLVPAALAVLLSFVLAPMVRLLQRYFVPRSIAVLSTVMLAFILIFGLGTLMAAQLTELATDLPRYQSTMQEKIRSFRGATEGGGGIVDRMSRMLEGLSRELNEQPAQPTRTIGPEPGVTPEEMTPIPVIIHQADPGALATLALIINPLLHPLATTGIIIIFVIFILLAREDLRNRLIRLAGAHDIQNTTAALDDAGRRLSRLFLTQVGLNSAYGCVIGLGLWLIGVPSPILWGVLAGALRFVPYVGAIIGAVFPIIFAGAVDPGWSMALWTLALFVVIEPIVGHGIEPMLYGRSTGLAPAAVVAAATFWTWLWGPIGLLLATPITVCLVVLGRHVKSLEFLDIMFGDRPALTPAELFYQRMLAGDPIEAIEKATEYLKERSLTSYYDQVALKGLELAQADHARGALDEERLSRIRTSLEELIDDLADQEDRPRSLTGTDDPEAEAAFDQDEDDEDSALHLPVLTEEALALEWSGEAPVLIISGRGPLDDSASRILAQLLGKHGLRSRIVGTEAISTANLFRLDPTGVALVCLSYLDPASLIPARTAAKRIRRRIPKAAILLGLWRPSEEDERRELPEEVMADYRAFTFEEAVRLCLAAATRSGRAQADAAAAGQAIQRSA
ncbi:AI-2E family transporter [Geminicoccus flavidas]|uniref:AI-2E family transporter n=1 Tax=Geminicoccus flavidas TaxID=2506407 RepID=UPI00190F62A9|nr:AI-2E family transporter [Geminicoccus flavidas]